MRGPEDGLPNGGVDVEADEEAGWIRYVLTVRYTVYPPMRLSVIRRAYLVIRAHESGEVMVAVKFTT